VISTEVRAGSHSYPVLIGPGLLDDAGPSLKQLLPAGRCAIISDPNVGPRFGAIVERSFVSAGFEPVLITIPVGEQSKTLQQAGALCDEMVQAGLDRQSCVIGLGGGVVGDLSGFVAAIFQRGIPHVQIPTTLLAMIDSSIGGKTGVNASAAKNLIGAVHHPLLVLDDVDVLKTLPRREITQGFAEIIKHAIIADAEMFSMLQDIDLGHVDFEPLIRRNVELKARIVAKDERDRTGERALLNFGHTIGHGIERAADYREISHGDAVSLGMVAAGGVSIKRAGLPREQRDAIVDLLRKFELPTQLPTEFSREKILNAVKFDKKFEHGAIRFVLTPKIGSAHLSHDVTMEDIREALEEL
jgi:3-dehydroquinate synthase